MRQLRLLIHMIIAAAFVVGLVACVNRGEQMSIFEAVDQAEHAAAGTKEQNAKQVTYLKLALSDAEESLSHQAATMFADKLNKISGGTMKVDIYPNDTLGMLTNHMDSGRNEVELRIGVSTSQKMRLFTWLPVLDPKFDLTKLDQAMSEGCELRKLIEQDCLEHGTELLGIFPSYYRMFTSNTRVTKVEEFKGLKMRTIGGGIDETLWSMLGMSTTAYAIRNTYLALQQDNVDSEENTYSVICSYRLYEQQKYLIRTNHKVYVDGIYINHAYFESLPEDQRQMIRKAVDETMEDFPVLMDNYMERMNSVIIQNGSEMVNWSEKERQKLFDIWRAPLWENLVEDYGEETVNQIIDLCR